MPDLFDVMETAHGIVKRKLKKKKKLKLRKPIQKYVGKKLDYLPEWGNRGEYSTYSKALRGD